MRKQIHGMLFLCVSLTFIFQLSIFNSATAQVVPASYRQQKQTEFDGFKDSIHDNFVRYLEHLWTEYQLFEGELSPRSNKPVGQPILDTADSGDTLMTDCQMSYGEITTLQMHKAGSDFIPPTTVAIFKHDYTVPFYGRQLDISLPEKIAQEKLSGIRERQVAHFWKKLVEGHADQCVASLDMQRRNLYLGDWGLFNLIRHLSAVVYPDHPDEQAVFVVFLLDAMHYDARLGRMDDRLVMLINTGSHLYDIPYIEVDTVRYYAFGNLPRKGRIHTYSHQLVSADTPIDMHLTYSPRLGGELANKPFNHVLDGHTIEVRINQPLIDYYARYPQTELSIYATAAMEEAFSATISREFRPFVADKTPIQALNTLLKFMQQGFVYQTDRKQFGREKNFFCEENFYYPANDCEDRAILFARMVQLLLGYDVVLLEYDSHVSTAVHIPGRKVRGHHLDIQGRRYMVCDPTFIGAAVGDLSRKYRNKSPKIIIL